MTRRAGFACLLGAPNVGKSTLLNHVVGASISIVTHKAQTTRARTRGIVQRGDTQIVLVDTPGLFDPRRDLDRAMVADAWRGAADADAIILIIAAERGVGSANRQALDKIATFGRPLAVAINKIDLVDRSRLLRIADTLRELAPIDAIFMISARRGDGVEDVVTWVAGAMPPGHWLYPDDMLGDLSMRDIAAELTREKLMLSVHDEIPYQLTVETERWTNLGHGKVRIDQIVYVSRDSHRRMIVGAGGTGIKRIGVAARQAIASILDLDVQLFIRVKTRPKWLSERQRYEAMRLDMKDAARLR